MVPESLPFIGGVIAACAAFYATWKSRPSYQSGLTWEILLALAAFLAAFAFTRVIFFLSMEQVLTGLIGGAFGGLVIGLLMAGSSYMDGEAPRDCWVMCAVPTAAFAVIGLLAGAIIAI